MKNGSALSLKPPLPLKDIEEALHPSTQKAPASKKNLIFSSAIKDKTASFSRLGDIQKFD